MVVITKRRLFENLTFYLIYLILFVLSVIDIKNITLYYGMLIIFNLLISLINRKNITPALLSSFLIGNEMIAIVNALAITIVIILKKIRTNIVDKKIYLYGILIAMFSIMNAIMNNTFVNVITSVTYIVMLFFIIINCYGVIENDMQGSLKGFVFIEFIITLLIVYIKGSLTPGDMHYGSLYNAHYLGNWCIVSLFALSRKHHNLFDYFRKDFVFIFMLLFMLYLSDSKTLVVCFIFILIITKIFNKVLLGRNGIKLFFISVYFVLFFGFGFLYSPLVEGIVTKYLPEHSKYIYSSSWNYKFYYFNSTLNIELRGIHFWTGYGLGQYGSRFANLFAYDSMYRNDSSLNRIIETTFKPHSIDNYIKYVSYYNSSFVQTIGYKSAILSYPFSSLIAFVGEMGIVGIYLVALIFNNLLKKSNLKSLLYYFLAICFFDNYFDMFLTVGYVLICLVNSDEDNVILNVE